MWLKGKILENYVNFKLHTFIILVFLMMSMMQTGEFGICAKDTGRGLRGSSPYRSLITRSSVMPSFLFIIDNFPRENYFREAIIMINVSHILQ